ncbi:putative allantoin permease, partial [Tetrabaena socialis]
MWATLTTNIAANIVAPANAFVNCAPKFISFEVGGLLTAGLGLVIMPWKLVSSTHGFVNTWLI